MPEKVEIEKAVKYKNEWGEKSEIKETFVCLHDGVCVGVGGCVCVCVDSWGIPEAESPQSIPSYMSIHTLLLPLLNSRVP